MLGAAANNRKKDAHHGTYFEFASSRFAASWMPSNIYSGKRDDFFAQDVIRKHARFKNS